LSSCAEDEENAVESVVKVQGMTCQGCVKSVTRVLAALPGVEAVEVSLERGEAALRHDPAKVGADDFRTAISDAGFEAG
jgi:copper chaperone